MGFRHSRTGWAALASVLLVAAGSLVALAVGASHRGTGGPRPGHPRTGAVTSRPPGGWHALPPATTVPPATPVQQRYDQGLRDSFSSSANRAQMARVAALQLPSPAVAGGWPPLAPTFTPAAWSLEFTAGLLDIDFAKQTRGELGDWLVAEEAPDLMPGIPAGAQLGTLYATVLEPGIDGQPSPVPSAPEWGADASAGVRWSVSEVRAEPDPQWQEMVAAGWRPTDLYAAVEDVSGRLTVTDRASAHEHGFLVGAPARLGPAGIPVTARCSSRDGRSGKWRARWYNPLSYGSCAGSAAESAVEGAFASMAQSFGDAAAERHVLAVGTAQRGHRGPVGRSRLRDGVRRRGHHRRHRGGRALRLPGGPERPPTRSGRPGTGGEGPVGSVPGRRGSRRRGQLAAWPPPTPCATG